MYYEQNLKNYSLWIEWWLIQNKIKDDKYSIDTLKIEKKEIEDKINLQTNEIKSIESLLENNDTTKRIKEIEQSILFLEKDESLKEQNYRNYKNYINVLGFEFNEKWYTEDIFLENIKNVNQKKDELTVENIKNEDLKIEYLTKKSELIKEKELKENELEYFKKRDNLLPERLSKIRQKISRFLWIDESKLMFVCELIKIKEDEKAWKMSIEKLLHSFWQEMLVPEKLLSEVNNFVDKNNLYSKIDIKHNSEFHNWIKDRILTRFNYACLNNTSSSNYYYYPLVLTISWLIRNKNSYIKDDREFWLSNYILWWDNKKKIVTTHVLDFVKSKYLYKAN